MHGQATKDPCTTPGRSPPAGHARTSNPASMWASWPQAETNVQKMSIHTIHSLLRCRPPSRWWTRPTVLPAHRPAVDEVYLRRTLHLQPFPCSRWLSLSILRSIPAHRLHLARHHGILWSAGLHFETIMRNCGIGETALHRQLAAVQAVWTKV
ncbi:hypothetical protein M011DRAFT_44685 [Sporormia fimetaria CBS 119925]|uniref:Uncharacterized protein n=1 Tax=Sporormia fimetaria CBS 119925 TaxID=1340428 RepID=A0A6A6VAA2_9PLEO|nr:hypothetical protein M011DRAFT_44685 [Sporormia fimetaria CBS 119925]